MIPIKSSKASSQENKKCQLPKKIKYKKIFLLKLA